MRKICKKYQKQLVLYHYNELEPDERVELEAHLTVCDTCQAELKQIKQVAGQLHLVEPPDSAVKAGRRLLLHRLRSGPSADDKRYLQRGFRVAIQIAMAVFLVGFGFWLGQRKSFGPETCRFTYQHLLSADPVTLDNVRVSPFLMSIDKIDVDPQNGRINVVYNTVNEIRLNGRPEDRELHAILYHALLNSDDMVLRLRAAKALQQIAHDLQQLDGFLINALEQQLYREENLGVKLALLDVINELPRTNVLQDILVNVMLYDQETAVRIHAFKSLTLGEPMDNTVKNLLVQSKTDSNTYIRTKSLELLNQSSASKPHRKEQSL